MQAKHYPFQRFQAFQAGFDDEQMLAGLFVPAPPHINRFHGRREDVHAPRQSLFDDRVRDFPGFSHRTTGDQHNSELARARHRRSLPPDCTRAVPSQAFPMRTEGKHRGWRALDAWTLGMGKVVRRRTWIAQNS